MIDCFESSLRQELIYLLEVVVRFVVNYEALLYKVLYLADAEGNRTLCFDYVSSRSENKATGSQHKQSNHHECVTACDLSSV